MEKGGRVAKEGERSDKKEAGSGDRRRKLEREEIRVFMRPSSIRICEYN